MIYSQIMINKCYRKNICMANKSCLLRELLYLIINERSSRTKAWSLSLIPLRYSIVDKNLSKFIYLPKNFSQLFFEIILLFTDTEMPIQKWTMKSVLTCKSYIVSVICVLYEGFSGVEVVLYFLLPWIIRPSSLVQ